MGLETLFPCWIYCSVGRTWGVNCHCFCSVYFIEDGGSAGTYLIFVTNLTDYICGEINFQVDKFQISQLAKSSRAIHGGAYFSAVCGRKLIPINAPGPYECQECNRLLFSPTRSNFFFALHSHAHCFRCSVGISNGFVMKQVTWICFCDKSM